MNTGKSIGSALALTVALGGLASAQQAPPVPARGDVMSCSGVGLDLLRPEYVRDLQQQLQAHGYYQGQIDSIPGPNTHAALEQYFRDRGQQNMAQQAAQGRVDAQVVREMVSDWRARQQEFQPVRGVSPEQLQPQSPVGQSPGAGAPAWAGGAGQWTGSQSPAQPSFESWTATPERQSLTGGQLRLQLRDQRQAPPAAQPPAGQQPPPSGQQLQQPAPGPNGAQQRLDLRGPEQSADPVPPAPAGQSPQPGSPGQTGSGPNGMH